MFRRPSCRRCFFFRPQAGFRVFDAGSHSTSDFLLGVLRWQTVPRACGYPANACARVVHFPSAVVAGTASAKLGGVVTTYNQSRDHGEQRLGSYLDTRSDPNIYVRYRARRRHRDPDSSARLLDSIGNRAALTMDTLIRLIAFHCLSDTFHCYLTYDPDYFRGADRFPGWDSLCLDPPGFRIDIGCVCVRSRIPIPCLLCAIPVV